MSIEELTKQTDAVYEKLKQLTPNQKTYTGLFTQRMNEVYKEIGVESEVVYGVEFVLLWQTLDSIVAQFNDVVSKLKKE